jgi:putative membrane protein
MARPGAPPESAAAPAEAAKLSDANIVALVDEANKADSSAGALAATKATNPDVKSFARLMMSEHHALRVQGQQLAKKAKITPQPPATDSVSMMAKAETDTLQSTPKGAQFDRTYISQEVTAHKAVLDLLNKAEASAQNAQLKALITKAKPVIQKHLDRAQAIEKKLGPSA